MFVQIYKIKTNVVQLNPHGQNGGSTINEQTSGCRGALGFGMKRSKFKGTGRFGDEILN